MFRDGLRFLWGGARVRLPMPHRGWRLPGKFGRVPDRVETVGWRFYWFVLAVLAVWRVTHLLNAEDGPWELLARLRRLAGAGWWGSLLGCFYCLSLWVAVPFAYLVGEGWKERLLLWPALSGGAILLERLTSREAPAAVTYTENEEADDVLRGRQDPISTRGSDEAGAIREPAAGSRRTDV